MLKKLKRTLSLSILLSLFNSFAFSNALKISQISTAALKLPLAITANYFDLQNDTKKYLIFDSLYCATDITDLILKICENGDDISPIEIGFTVYHLIKFLNNIKKISNLETNVQKTTKETIPNYKLKKTIYTILKYATLIGDSYCSLGFGAREGTCAKEYRSLFSWDSGFVKILNVLIDNKNCQIHAKPLVVITVLATFVYTFSQIDSIDQRKLNQEEIRRHKEQEEHLRRQSKQEERRRREQERLRKEQEKQRKEEEKKWEKERKERDERRRREQERLRKEREKQRKEEAKKWEEAFFNRRRKEAFNRWREERDEQEEKKRRYQQFNDDFFNTNNSSSIPRTPPRNTIPNFYSILGVSRNATEAEIKKAYHKLALKVHPDKNKNSQESTETFKIIHQAYETLSNETNRQNYNECLNAPFLYGGTPPNFEVKISSQVQNFLKEINAKSVKK